MPPAGKAKPAAKKTATRKPTAEDGPRSIDEAVVRAPKAEAPEPQPTVVEKETPEGTVKLITMKHPIVVKDLATTLGLKPFQVVHILMEMNVFATLNQTIDEETAKKVCEQCGFQFELERREKGAGFHKQEEAIEEPPPPPPVVPSSDPTIPERPPVITFMGHVDHGKTSLLDAIRKTRVASGEAGGITQHIGAYQVERKGKKITFLDTPGHAAFTAMRARGANATDIAVIVVAADDGLMPQTLEAIQHAKAAGVSIMVALNKIDLKTAQPDKVKAELQDQGLVPEDWGGETIVCPVSATEGTGVEELLEMMLLQAEMLELRGDPSVPARAVVIESQIEMGKGPNATVIVQHGTLRRGDSFICGPYWGKVKAMFDDRGKQVKEAGPATPVQVLGFSGAPAPGEELTVMKSEKQARALSDERLQSKRLEKLGADRPVTLENLFSSLGDDQKKTLNLVIKADVQGSLEAIVDALKKLPSDKVNLHFILTAVGPITENDVLLAKASSGVVIGFNTKTENNAANAAKREEVQIKLYSIIYELLDQVKESMQGLLDPEERENIIGQATVRKVFTLSKFPVAGCVVESGRVTRSARARVLRRNQPIYDGGVVTLKRFQDDVNEVRAGMECGVRLGKFNDYEQGDIIQCYELEKIAQTLE